jgi:hypothetical protein
MRNTQMLRIRELYEDDGTRVECGFSTYMDNVLNPIVDGAADKGALAVWLSRQLDEWELEAERPDSIPFAPQVVAAIEQALALALA